MSTDRDTTRIVRSWLEEGPSALPDRVLDAVLDQLPATSQRRPWWPARRFSEMNNALKLVIAAAAVVVVALVGINLLPRTGGIVAGPGPSPTPIPSQSGPPMQTPEPTPTPTPAPSGSFNFIGDYVAGTTYVIEDRCCLVPGRMTFTMPATGWSAPLEAWRIGKNIPGVRASLTCLSPRISSGTSTRVAAVGMGPSSIHPSARQSMTSRRHSSCRPGPVLPRQFP
jgi:hypothetical protein